MNIVGQFWQADAVHVMCGIFQELITTGDLNHPGVKQQLMKKIKETLETTHFEQSNGEDVWSKGFSSKTAGCGQNSRG